MKFFLLVGISICCISLIPGKSKLEGNAPHALKPVVIPAKPSTVVGFCETNPLNSPEKVQFGNVNYAFSKPAYLDYVEVNGEFYGFLVNNWPGKLLRLDFGYSLLNRPEVVDLGTVNGILPNNTEGIQIIQQEERWYAIIVGGDPRGGEPSAIVRIDFGNDITSRPAGGEYWGNIGELDYPHDLVIFREEENWYGITVNTNSHSVTRFSFGTDISKKPNAENLGNIGELDDPTGICLKRYESNIQVYITNATGRSLSILDFGGSILNKPAVENIKLNKASPWDIEIVASCGQKVGYVLDALNGGIIRIEFDKEGGIRSENTIRHSNLSQFDFPHSLSKPFIESGDLCFFVPDANYHTLTLLKFDGCNEDLPKNTNL